MAIELKVPTVGESITEVLISEWLKKEGDTVAEGEPLVVIETDKVNVELPALQAGTIVKIVKGNGESAVVGEVIGLFEPGAGQAAPAAAAAPAASPAPAPAAPAAEAPAAEAAKDPAARAEAAQAAASEDAEPTGDAPAPPAAVMPAAARVLAQQGLEASAVEATGKGGWLEEDVLRHVDRCGDSGRSRYRAARPPPAALPLRRRRWPPAAIRCARKRWWR